MIETPVKERKKAKTQKLEERVWYLIDAKNKVLGRIATRVAIILMGKNKPAWQPNLDIGDNIIIINAAKIYVSGRKEEQKMYYRYSGYPGGLRVETLKKLRERKPEDIIYHAVSGMLPKNRLGAAMLRKLFVYPQENHPHEAQNPQNLEV